MNISLFFLSSLGNKGAVGVSFMFNGTSFGFVNCHLTSGNEKIGRYKECKQCIFFSPHLCLIIFYQHTDVYLILLNLILSALILLFFTIAWRTGVRSPPCRRNQNYLDILRLLSLGDKQLSSFDISLRFTHLFWLGDLNYRLDMDIQVREIRDGHTCMSTER